MKLIDKPTPLTQICQMAQENHANLVKAVVDINKKLLVVDADLHADEEQYLLEKGSKQRSLWGINLYPEKFATADFVEFDSVINLRPGQNNLSRGVEDAKIRNKITALVKRLIKS